MTPELLLLTGTAATVAFVHTLLGPDHYLPFVAMAKARGWGMRKTLKVTLWCGLGHLLGSVALGLAGIVLGSSLSSLVAVEAVRGEVAAWLLCGLGLAYMAWGIRRALRNRPHTHWHQHGELVHDHEHGHGGSHAHLHDQRENAGTFVPWVIFVIFVLGPCEPLVPLLMYPAATHSLAGVAAVTLVFGVVTTVTMLGAVMVVFNSIRGLRLRSAERYAHALAGFALFACGAGMALLGL
jgi:ABC-type nickel/cobalt efflux system permease component RcnA